MGSLGFRPVAVSHAVLSWVKYAALEATGPVALPLETAVADFTQPVSGIAGVGFL